MDNILQKLSHYLTLDTINFSKVNLFVLALPFYWPLLQWLSKFLLKFSWRIQEKSFRPFSATCSIIYSKTQNQNKFLRTEYNSSEALFLAEQEFIFQTYHTSALVKEDFVEPIILTGDKKFELLEIKNFSNEINNKIEPIVWHENSMELILTPLYIKPNSSVKIKFQYHAEAEVNFHAKVIIKDGKEFDKDLDQSYNKWHRYSHFSAISFGNNLWLGLPIMTFIPSFILYGLIIISFKINTPITAKTLMNPLFAIVFGIVFLKFIFPKFREWERGFVMNLKEEIWKEI